MTILQSLSLGMGTAIYRRVALGAGRAVLAIGWSTARKRHLSVHPWCFGCGHRPKKWAKNNDVHHIVPRHVDASLVTSPSNLVTLCRKNGCHLRKGHFGNYREYWNVEIKDIYQGVAAKMMAAERRNRKAVDG